MTWRLVLLEPEHPGPEWAPFAGCRPVADLRVGAFRLWERWQRCFGCHEVAIVSPHTPHFVDAGSPPLLTGVEVTGPAIVARSTVAPRVAGHPVPVEGARGFALGGRTVAWVVPPGAVWQGPEELGDAVPLHGGLALHGAVDLLTASESLLEDDCRALATEPGEGVPAAAVVLGDPAWVVVRGASVEPNVVFDVRGGPVVLDQGVIVRAGARLEGPLYVGPHSIVVGGALRHSAIGPQCRVHGEVSSSVFLGYANKSHDGFLGHSVVGHWVNLGAGTITSNLKNTYGPIAIEVDGRRIPTGRTNLGTLFGDHVKTAIGTLLGTGTVLGVGANVFGGPVPKHVAPFAWGAEREWLDADRFVRVAMRVMPRRGVEITPEIEASLRAMHRRFRG